MKRVLSIVLALIILLIQTSVLAASSTQNNAEVGKTRVDEAEVISICSKIQERFSLYIDASEGDWLSVYYDETDNTFYAYADVFLARYGCMLQYQYDDPSIYTLMKYYLFGASSNYLWAMLSKTCKNSRMVFAYVTGGKLEDYNEYYIGNRFDREYKDVSNKPAVLYSLTIEDCKKGEYEVFDWFFGDDKPITITEASPYLR